MRTPLLYRIAQLLTRAAAALYFEKVEITGAKHIPPFGPVILAANHPQSVTDGLVLALGAGRMVHYLAHSGLFKNKLRARLLRNLGAIPVHRRADVEDAADKNVEMFATCESLLERGGVMGIFPEGVSVGERHVHKLKTGVARIALQSEVRCGWELGVKIVPVGLNFESHRLMRTRVLVRFGQPITTRDYRDAYEKDPVEAVTVLTQELQDALRKLVVNIERPQFVELVRDVERVYKDELLASGRVAIPGGSKFEKDQVVSREIPRALDFFLERRPDVVWRIGSLLKEYRRKLDRLRLRDEMLREDKELTVRREATRLLILGALGLPIAAYGGLCNFVPYKLTGWLARRMAKDSSKVHYYHLTLGAAIYLFYYAGILYLTYRTLGPARTLVFAATLPPTGLFARAYTRHIVQRQRMLRFAFFQLTHRYYAQRIRQQRQYVIAEIDAAVEEYAAAQRAARRQAVSDHGDSDGREDQGNERGTRS
jgi:1-acyl-sn-glycerol-3-phosphate acyltransferase